MPVIYELRGKPAGYGELGINLYSGCAIGCRYCYEMAMQRVPWEKWTSGARPRRNILSQLAREAKRLEGDPREIVVCTVADPYQSNEAARLTRKALLIFEQYHLRVQVMTLGGMRSAADFDILARNRWKYGTMILFHSECLREEWEPGGPPIAERIQALREAHAAGIYNWVQIHPTAYPAELIDVVESLRTAIDAWKIGRSLPGGPPVKAAVGGRPGFVDADTALVYLRRMVELGLRDKLPRAEEAMKVWSPDQRETRKGGEAADAEE